MATHAAMVIKTRPIAAIAFMANSTLAPGDNDKTCFNATKTGPCETASVHEKGVGLFLHQQRLDTTTTAGKAMFQMLGVFAEFERGIIRERVNAGLARAKANGTKLGRRRVKPSVEARILELRANGDGILKIGKKLGIGTSVVQRVFKQEPSQA